MKKIAKPLIFAGLAIVVWSVYIFIKYIGLGGDNSYTPFSGLLGLVIVVLGIGLLKK